ncbi:MAG: poly(3-hydroxybutyrate) depolymerase PhaZ, partial [Undibacterium sp.]|nr:poly(3-hydroxybutyrate) depolymerase PhaZ [Undibacterium sp.]
STGESWKDAAGKTRVSYVQATGMGHAWPAGAGGSGGGTYVDYTHVNYPAYVTRFFFDNNLRVSRDAAPVMTTCAATAASSSSATISGAATDNGSIASYAVSLTGATAVNDTAAGSAASFSKTYNLASGYYSGTVSATDNLGQVSASCTIAQFLVGSPPAILPPAGLAVVSTTAGSAALSWTAVSGASGYNVYRNGSKVTATPATSIAYTDTGLTASTTYSYQVSSIDASSLESSLSASVSGTTKSAWTCSTTSASNYAHVQAGRAHNSAGYALANGSNQNMGLNNLFYTSVLAQTSAGYYIKGNCP